MRAIQFIPAVMRATVEADLRAEGLLDAELVEETASPDGVMGLEPVTIGILAALLTVVGVTGLGVAWAAIRFYRKVDQLKGKRAVIITPGGRAFVGILEIVSTSWWKANELKLVREGQASLQFTPTQVLHLYTVESFADNAAKTETKAALRLAAIKEDEEEKFQAMVKEAALAEVELGNSHKELQSKYHRACDRLVALQRELDDAQKAAKATAQKVVGEAQANARNKGRDSAKAKERRDLAAIQADMAKAQAEADEAIATLRAKTAIQNAGK